MLTIWSCASAQTVIVTWDANTEPDLAGYKIYYGTQSRTYDTIINIGADTIKLLNGFEVDKEYFFAVTAYDSAGNESEYSDEVSIVIKLKDKIPPNKVAGIQIKVTENGEFEITAIIRDE